MQWLPSSWISLSVAYNNHVTLQRWSLFVLIDASILLAPTLSHGGGGGGSYETWALLFLLGLSVTSAATSHPILGYSLIHIVVMSAALVRCIFFNNNNNNNNKTNQTSTATGSAPLVSSLCLLPAALLLHSTILRLLYCGASPLLACLDICTVFTLCLLAATRAGCCNRRFFSTTTTTTTTSSNTNSSGIMSDSGDITSIEQPLLLSADHEETVSATTATTRDTDTDTPISLHDKASFLEFITFSWLNTLFSTGAKRQLRWSDIEGVPMKDATEISASAFAAVLSAQHVAGRRGILRALIKIWGWDWLVLGFLQALCVSAALASPLILQLLLEFLQAPDSGETLALPWLGLGCACALAALQAFAAIVTAQLNYLSSRLQLRIRAALLPSLQARLFAAPLRVRRNAGAGLVTNLVSVDVDRVLGAVLSLHQFWSLPIQVMIVIAQLHAQVSWASAAGVGILAILVPLNVYVATRIGSLTANMMTARDTRVQATREILSGIRAVKMGSLEGPLLAKVRIARGDEMNALTERKYLDAVCVWCWASTPLLMALATFSLVLTLPDADAAFTPAKVWSSLAMLQLLIFPLNAFPWMLSGLLEARVSLTRLNEFLSPVDTDSDIADAPTLQVVDGKTLGDDGNGSVLCRAHGAFAFVAQNDTVAVAVDFEAGVLTEKNGLSISRGELIVVVGATAAGKSALLLSLLGELTRAPARTASTLLDQSCTIAFVPQLSWVRATTLRDNIVMGLPSSNSNTTADTSDMRLLQVLAAVGLEEEAKTRGLDTPVAESTLSGGQRQRLALARALYASADLVLIDDVTSALDATVSSTVWKNAIGKKGMLAAESRARVVVTHDVRFIREADRVLAIRDGIIIFLGTPEELALDGTLSASLGLTLVGDDDDNTSCTIDNDKEKSGEANNTGYDTNDDDSGDETIKIVTNYNGKTRHEESSDDDNLNEGKEEKEASNDETREAGRIKSSIFAAYLTAVGMPLTIILLLSLFLMQFTRNAADWWLSEWSAVAATRQTQPEATSGSLFGALSDVDFLIIYASIAIANFFLTLVRAGSFAAAGLRAARVVHTRLLAAVVAAPLSFFDATPAGRLMNRLSTDQFAIDDSLPFSLNILLAQAAGLIGMGSMLAYATRGAFVLLMPPLAFAFLSLQTHYRATSRELKRLDAVARSPLLSQLSDVLTGEAVILAAARNRIPSQCAITREYATTIALLDISQRSTWASAVAGQWLAMRLQGLGVLVLFILCLFSVLSDIFSRPLSAASSDDAGCVGGAPASPAEGAARATAGIAGLSLSYAIPLVAAFQGLIGAITDTEREFVSVERAVEYMSLEPEDTAAAESALEALAPVTPNEPLPPPDAAWRPANGEVNIERLTVSYPSAANVAVSDVSFSVKEGTRLGICGRTGAGKSSLIAALFRLAPVTRGRVLIGGDDVAKVPLRSLRACATIVGQEPFIAAASLRFNLDPHNAHTDNEIIKAAAACGLTTSLYGGGGGGVRFRAPTTTNATATSSFLDVPLESGGRNLSAGQRQLVCLTRALLYRAPVIVLDEAASATDAATDAAMSEALRSPSFHGVTVIIVAHRIATLLACDQIIVLDQGTLVEGPESPTLLRKVSGGHFARLCQAGQVK